MHYLPQRLKSTFFQKTLILDFEVIVQPPKHIFEISRVFFFEWRVPEGDPGPGVKKIFQKSLILAFEVLVHCATTQTHI